MIAAGVLAAAAPLGSAQAQFQVQINANQTPPDEDPYGVYLPTDRTLARGITRARERLQAGEYNEALAFLQQLLDRDEDVFVDDGAGPDQLHGLKSAARALIAGLPAAGRQMYDLLHSAAARRELDAALASGDRTQLVQLVRRYFLTAPGYEAALVLAQTELDRGHALSAAHLYDELLADPTTAAPFEPQLSLLAAISWRAAGRTDAAAIVLRAAAKKYADAQVELAGRKLSLPNSTESDAELLAWLDDAVGKSQVVDAASADWLTLRGDASRNSQQGGGAPHLSPRWESRVVNDPRFESFLAARGEQAEQQGLAAISAARPIAIGNVVLMRTPQNVVAIDWQTGKRIWETREEETTARDQYLADFMSENNTDQFASMSHPLEQRVWDDTLTMSLSSDGQRVFALSGMALNQRDDQPGWNVGPGFGGQFDFTASPTNRLTAYELATEGKLAWEIDGANASDDLAGVFFLGTPVAVDGSLYVLAEIRSAIYLLSLEPATGKLQWRQQLAGLEQGIMLDPQRRLSAATPSYSAGILVCPTTAGIVVGIDLVRREFAWVYRYPRQVESFANIRPGWQGRAEIGLPRANNHAIDGTAIVADGKVLVTPPESADVHCLELSSGKLLWKKPREKALYLASVDRGNAVFVGADSVTALRLADGAAAWSKDVALPEGVLAAGLGYLSEGEYYLPLSSGQILAINTADGSIVNMIDAPSDVSVGNLICHQGSIISQSAMFLDKFEQIEVLRKRAESALAANPQDAAAIRDLAEMKRLDGALDEAVPMLKQAYEIDPNDLLTRDMLGDALLQALAGDYAAYRADLPLLREIVDRPQQQLDLLRIDAQGLDAAGERKEAFAAYLRLIDATAKDPATLTLDGQHSARSDCWIEAQLTALWKSCSPVERNEIIEQLAARRKAWGDKPSASDLRSYLSFFDGLPGADAVRIELVRRLMDNGDPLETEMELLRLANSSSSQSQARATVYFVQWLLGQGRHEQAAAMAASIGDHRQSARPIDGKSIAEWLQGWQAELSGASEDGRDWPRGRTTVEDLPPTSTNRPDMTRRAQAEFQLGLRSLRLEQVGGPPIGASQWLISQDGTRLIGRDAAGREMFHFSPSRRSPMRRFGGNADLVQAAQLGDLLYVTLGGQVVALDTRENDRGNDSDVVWQTSRRGRFRPTAGRAGRGNAPSVYHPWSQRRRVPGAAIGIAANLGPATSAGVVYQDQQQLRAVDPLSGDMLWTRSDIPLGCELFGDSDYALAADPIEKTLYVLRMSDGELIERRPLPELPWLLTSGRNVALLADSKQDERPRKTLRIVDTVSGKTLFESDCDPRLGMTTLEPESIAVVEPDGRFQLVNVRTAEREIDQNLPLAGAPRSISAYRAGTELFLGIGSSAGQPSSRKLGSDYPLVDGQLFAFDLRDGRSMWPGPAVLESRGLAVTQPADIPVLVFVDQMTKGEGNGGSTKLRLLCIDRATGETIYRNDDLPATSGGHVRIRATRGESDSVDVEMTAKTIRLKFSDSPRSPEPPANDLVEAPRKSLGRGLWGVTRRMGSVLQDVLQNSGGRDRGLDAGDGNQGPLDDD